MKHGFCILQLQQCSQLEHHLLCTYLRQSQLAHLTSVVDNRVRASLHVICCGHPCQSQLARPLLWTSVLVLACTSSVVNIRVRASLHVISFGHQCQSQLTHPVVDIRVSASLHVICCGHLCQSQLARHMFRTSVRDSLHVIYLWTLVRASKDNLCCGYLSQSLHVIGCSHPCNNQLAHQLMWKSESEPACTSSVVDISL